MTNIRVNDTGFNKNKLLAERLNVRHQKNNSISGPIESPNKALNIRYEASPQRSPRRSRNEAKSSDAHNVKFLITESTFDPQKYMTHKERTQKQLNRIKRACRFESLDTHKFIRKHKVHKIMQQIRNNESDSIRQIIDQNKSHSP